MKNAVIFHGTACNPEFFWYPYLKNNLEERGYHVWVPQLPQAQKPDINIWLPFALENGKYDEETVIVGHSAGCPLTLAVLESLNVKVTQAILVAGFCTKITGHDAKILKRNYDWEKIKSNAGELIFINSDDDPWGINEKAGRELFEHLGDVQITLHGQGHMGSTKFNQPYKEFPLLARLVA